MTTTQARTKWGRTKFGTGRTPAMAIAVPAGVILAGAGGWLSVLVGVTAANPALGFWVFSACLTMPAIALVYVLVVDRDTLEGAVERPDDSIESRWYDRAASGSFMDLVAGLGITLIVLTFVPGGVSVDLDLVLAAVLAACFASFGIRYLVLRRKG
ncbi:hypothetical protein [Kocuria turfanensis]|uniref:DUF2178 domain-containing protein n=2 Tax=Kocuria turfanensis TaxID=388357 RepID=A0A512IHB7_9MICC|nr:hypothetical protein [Kocuria turfanensis]GEO97105.1 hypothetical protein KTU01_32280 [Kocuria turfanensis]